MLNSNTFKIVGGIVGIALCLLFFPIALSGIDTVLANPNIADYTGLETIAKITPMIIWVSIFLGSALAVFSGAKGSRRGGGKRRMA
jgi:ABC-type antimicrobial peptide transport system permease subunit